MSRPARPFFIPKAHGPLRAAGHVAASEPSRAGRQGPKPQDIWQRWSTPEQGGGVRSCGARVSAGALPSKEAGSGAAGHVAVRRAPCLRLEACMRVTRSTGYQQTYVI
jgi:hypothetical protein